MRVAVVLVVMAASLLISAGYSDLFGSSNAYGEILTAHAFPEFLEAGKPEVFEVDVNNLGNYSNFLVEVERDSHIIARQRLKLDALDNGTFTFAASQPPVVGEFNYTYRLYPGITWGPRALLGSVSEKRRVYSQRELSDEDGDSLRYYEEVSLGTEPGLADTDGDGIADKADPYPVQASGSLKITSVPDGEVYLDDALEGGTPLYIPYVSMGLRKIEVKKEGYVTSVQMVSLKPGENLNMSFLLSPVKVLDVNIVNRRIEEQKNTFIYAASQPSGAEVFLDDVFVGTTSLVVQSRQGTHRMLFKKSGFNDSSLQINLTSEDKNVFVNLEPGN